MVAKEPVEPQHRPGDAAGRTAGISSYIGVRKVLRIEPFDIFRG
jgi:hypothetical protein